jgi:hypothetical protein
MITLPDMFLEEFKLPKVMLHEFIHEVRRLGENIIKTGKCRLLPEGSGLKD